MLLDTPASSSTVLRNVLLECDIVGSTGVASYYLYGSKKHADAPAINTFKTAALFQNLNVSRLLFTENGPGTALHRLSALQVEMISACYDD